MPNMERTPIGSQTPPPPYRRLRGAAEKKSPREKIKLMVQNYSETLKQYGIKTSSKDGSISQSMFTETYGLNIIKNLIIKLKERKKLQTERKSEQAEQLEKIVPITLMKTFTELLKEMRDPETLEEYYKQYAVEGKERDIFDYLMKEYVPNDLAVLLTNEYDDRLHGIDCYITGKYILCSIDVTTDTHDDGTITKEKEEKINKHVEDTTRIYYGIQLEEERGEVYDGPILANFPHIYAAISPRIVSRIINFLTPSMEQPSEEDMEFSRHIILQLSTALDKIRDKHPHRETVARYLEEAEIELGLPNQEMTTDEKVDKAYNEWCDSVDMTEALFYCTDQYLSKKLNKEEQVELPKHLLPKELSE